MNSTGNTLETVLLLAAFAESGRTQTKPGFPHPEHCSDCRPPQIPAGSPRRGREAVLSQPVFIHIKGRNPDCFLNTYTQPKALLSIEEQQLECSGFIWNLRNCKTKQSILSTFLKVWACLVTCMAFLSQISKQ
jgi:hypothetical protein